MARAIRWTVPFVSFNGTSCHVDIYDEGWNGSVTTLTGAANPFEYEENNDADLLNGVIRYRTGYLRVIEQSHGELAALYPQVNTDRYIEFYYGNTLDFNGFIQAQEFENGWEPGPRVLEFPVISPLGLAESVIYDWHNYNRPGWLRIHELIGQSFNLLQGNYDSYCFPQYLPHDSQLTKITYDLWVNSLTFCPFGDTYDKNDNLTLDGIYNPKSVGYALKSICTAFGLILHDAPRTPIFQRVDWAGDYFTVRFDFSTAATRHQQSIINLPNVAEIAGNENVESVVIPLSKIEVTYDGTDDIPAMSFDRCQGYLRGCAIEGKFCTNKPKIDDLQGTFVHETSINNNGDLGQYGIVCLGAYGVSALEEAIMWQPGGEHWTNNKVIASYTFYEWFGEHPLLKFRFRYGNAINDLTHIGASTKIAVSIRTGNYYWDGTNWSLTSSVATPYSKVWDEYTEDCEVEFLSTTPAMSPEPLEVVFYVVSGNVSGYIYLISDVKLMLWPNAGARYLDKNKNKKSFIIKGDPSINEGDVTCGYSITAHTQNQIRYNTNIIIGDLENDIKNNQPKYPYLTKAQDRLMIDVKMPYQSPMDFYINRLTLWGSNKKWRTIARTFRPWDDIYQLTFHHSTVFDN